MFQDKPQITISKTGERLYLRHGPIDLFIEIDTQDQQARLEGFKVAAQTFKTILPELCEELSLLRQPVEEYRGKPSGPVASKMYEAASSHASEHFVTPMVAVAGSVAEHLLETIFRAVPAEKIFVNNGGDIALHLAGDKSFKVGICSDLANGDVDTHATVHASDNIGGIATSGWAGRSHSLGIADAVTVFAETATLADAAASLIANTVDLPRSDKIVRLPANELAPDSDLGGCLVTTDVATLSEFEKEEALQKGEALANNMQNQGLIHSAYLTVQGSHAIVSHTKNGTLNQFIPTDIIKNQTGLTHA